MDKLVSSGDRVFVQTVLSQGGAELLMLNC